jgi:hypothetical protein
MTVQAAADDMTGKQVALNVLVSAALLAAGFAAGQLWPVERGAPLRHFDRFTIRPAAQQHAPLPSEAVGPEDVLPEAPRRDQGGTGEGPSKAGQTLIEGKESPVPKDGD